MELEMHISHCTIVDTKALVFTDLLSAIVTHLVKTDEHMPSTCSKLWP